MISWLLLGIGLLSVGRRRPRAQSGRHRPGAELRPRSGLLPFVVGVAASGACPALLGAAGLLLTPFVAAGVMVGVQRLPRRQASGEVDSRTLALLLDLLAGALDAGLPINRALAAIAESAASMTDAAEARTARIAPGSGSAALAFVRAAEQLRQVGRLLSLGAQPEVAWGRLESLQGYRVVGVAGQRCAHSGARLARALRATAYQLRHDRHAASVARAERCGVWVLLPLGLCFLPAFVCLGIAPTILGVAQGIAFHHAGGP